MDLQPPATQITSKNFTHIKADVTSWADLSELFSKIHNKLGRIDILYANAGIGKRTDFLNLEQDDKGNLVQPDMQTLEINLMAIVNQVALATHFMQRQEPKGGSIILTASCTSYQRFASPDYVTAKAGVVGLLRSFSQKVSENSIPIRINAVAPSWTRTGMVTLPEEEFRGLGLISQPAEAVAKSVLFLVGDKTRHGQCLYSAGGRYVEMEEPVHDAMLKAIGKTGLAEEDERVKVYKRYGELQKKNKGG